MEIKTIDLVSLDPPAAPVQARQLSALGRSRAWLRRERGFVLCVVVPVLLGSLYFGLLAGDRYETETRFVVRSPSTAATNQLSSLVQGSSIMRSADDAYIVHAFMKSRDAVRLLVEKGDLMQRLNRPEADLFWAYPGPILAHSAERLWRHFQSHIDIDFDQTTGITTLKVQASRPEDARALAQALLDSAEGLINGMSARAQNEGVIAAEKEAARAREQARVALEKIAEFRRRTSLIDPTRTSTQAMETITRLSVEVSQTNAELAELRQVSPNSPQANSLRLRLTALEEQIRKEREALAGTDASLAPQIAEYERLSLEREFAHTSFTSAQAAYNIARSDAERQRLFLDRISAPTVSDYPKYPYRILGILAVALAGWVVYSIGSLLLADTRGHAGN